MRISNKYYQETQAKKSGTRNFAYLAYPDVLEEFLSSEPSHALKHYLFQDALDDDSRFGY